MRFSELSLENFRSFAQKTTVKFENKNEKPAHMFIGENGAGKTTLFLAIIWALQGENAIVRYAETRKKDAQAPKNNYDLINKTILQSEKPFMRVSLIFEHEGQNYYLFRSLASKIPYPKKNNDFNESISLRKGGTGKEESDPQGVLNDILPIDASQFFFFDGEDVRRYSGGATDETRKAIERVLGIPEIREAREDIQKLAKKFLNQLGEQQQSGKEAADLSRDLSKASEEYEMYSKTLEVKRKDLASTTSQLTVYEAKRDSLKDITKFSLELQDIKRRADAIKQSRDDMIEGRDKLVKDLPFYLIAPTVRGILDRLKRTVGTDDISKQIQVVAARMQVIGELEQSNECLCGNDLQEGTKLHLHNLNKKLEKQLIDLKNRGSKKTTPPIEDIQYVLGRIESINVDFASYEHNIKKLELELVELDDKKRGIERKIKGSNIAEAELIQETIDKLHGNEGELHSDIRNLEGLVGERGRQAEVLKADLRKAQLKAGQLSTISVKYDLTQKLTSALEWIVKEMIVQKKEIIVKNASDFFSNVAPREGYSGINIDEDYSIWLLDNKNNREKPSEGYKELVALSFIFGLNKAASYNAPVVMDFVLGRLDSSRQYAVVDNFSNFASQIIILLLDTELLADGVSSKMKSISSQTFAINRNLTTGASTVQVMKN